MLMASGLETEPQSNVSTQEDDTLTPSNKSQADSLSGSTSGLERSESGLGLAGKLRRSSSSGQFNARSPVLSPWSEGQTGPTDSLMDQESWDTRMSETEAGTPASGQPNALVQSCSQNQISVVQSKICLTFQIWEKKKEYSSLNHRRQISTSASAGRFLSRVPVTAAC